MPKIAKELSALAVSRLTKPGYHAVGGCNGLNMQVGAGGSRSWVLRLCAAGKRREMGLGSFPSVTLAQARDLARKHRLAFIEGANPIEERYAARSAATAAEAAQ